MKIELDIEEFIMLYRVAERELNNHNYTRAEGSSINYAGLLSGAQQRAALIRLDEKYNECCAYLKSISALQRMGGG